MSAESCSTEIFEGFWKDVHDQKERFPYWVLKRVFAKELGENAVYTIALGDYIFQRFLEEEDL